MRAAGPRVYRLAYHATAGEPTGSMDEYTGDEQSDRGDGTRCDGVGGAHGVAVRVDLQLTPKDGSTRTVRLGTVTARAPLATLRQTVTGPRAGMRYSVKPIAVNGGTNTSLGTTVSFTTKR